MFTIVTILHFVFIFVIINLLCIFVRAKLALFVHALHKGELISRTNFIANINILKAKKLTQAVIICFNIKSI